MTMKSLAYGVIIVSLFAIDYILGNGIVDMFRTIYCRINSLTKKSYKEEIKNIQMTDLENPMSLPVMLTEIILLSLTLALFKRFKQFRGIDRITQLLQESKEEINNANDILEKLRLRKINWQVPNDCPYLDDEPQVIKPFKLEVPILHMAIIDTQGSSRNQPERGDAGDITDSALLSISSLIDEDFNPTPDSRDSDEKIDQKFDNNSRYLWDVMEEDMCVDKD